MNSFSGPTPRVEDGLPSELPSPQAPETSLDYYAITGSTNTGIPQVPPTEPPHRTSFTIPSILPLCYIIAGNCICSGAICLCLWGFSKVDDLTKLEKRAFNAVSLLLSAGLGFGIGFLCDRIGLFARGTILRNRPHSVEEVCVGTPFTSDHFACLCYVGDVG